MSDKEKSGTQKKIEAVVKGILIGGSLGCIVGWTGLISLYKAAGLGMLCGCLAGLTFRDMREDKE